MLNLVLVMHSMFASDLPAVQTLNQKIESFEMLFFQEIKNEHIQIEQMQSVHKTVLYSDEQNARRKIRRQERKVEILEDEETLHIEHKSAYANLTDEKKSISEN
jgi:hypothetical protein